MKIVRFIQTLCLLVLVGWTPISQVSGAPAGWAGNLPEAQEQAQTDGKLILLDFTGSDWCGWCMKLDRDIFQSPRFKTFASQNLVLLQVDFPHSNELSKELKEQNASLARQFKVSGFPTLILLNLEGKTLDRFDGYPTGGLDAFMERLKKMIPSKNQDPP